jgi:non-ribosomal peptide synthetase component F
VSSLQLVGELLGDDAAGAESSGLVEAGPDTIRAERLTYGGLDRRSNRLARGLVSLGVLPGDVVVVLCCDRHRGDRVVGYLGAQKVGAAPIVLPLLPSLQLRDRLLARPPRLILACSEGVASWRQSGVSCRVVGDEPGVTWWKLLEVRHSPAPFERTSADVSVSSEVGPPK